MNAKSPVGRPSLRSSESRHWTIWVGQAALAMLASLLFFVQLGRGALRDWDEAIYAEVSKEILTGHHWLTLYWQHQPFFEKPPLSLWIQAALFHGFGISELWARVPSALAGVALVLLTFAIARRLYGVSAGFLAAFVLLTCRQFDNHVRQGTTDALLCLCIYLVLYAWTRLSEDHAGWFYVLCIALGLGAMIKGPAVLVALPPLVVDRLSGNRPAQPLNWRHYAFGALLFLAIVAPWHLWMVAHYGRAFLQSYIGYQLAARATHVLEGSGGGPLYYARVLLIGAFPWSLVILFAFVRWLRRKHWRASLLWALMGTIIVLYTLIPTKHDWYLLPIYPALAVEVAALFAELGKGRAWVRSATVGVLTTGVLIAFVKIASRPGDPLANQMAKMAQLAKASGNSAPLFVVAEAGHDPEPDAPTAVFYSGRRVTVLEMPADEARIADALQARPTVDAVIQRDALAQINRNFRIHLIAQDSLLSYGTLSAR